MARVGLDGKKVIEKAAELANQSGMSNVTMKTLAEYLGIKTPSLYNHVKSQDDLYEKIMIYGWQQISDRIMDSSKNLHGNDALRTFSREFFQYALENKGIFEAMMWYNKYSSPELEKATEKIYTVFFSITDELGIPLETANHLLRTYRAFLQGFASLVIHDSFGNPISIQESFEISLNVLLKGSEQYYKTVSLP